MGSELTATMSSARWSCLKHPKPSNGNIARKCSRAGMSSNANKQSLAAIQASGVAVGRIACSSNVWVQAEEAAGASPA